MARKRFVFHRVSDAEAFAGEVVACAAPEGWDHDWTVECVTPAKVKVTRDGPRAHVDVSGDVGPEDTDGAFNLLLLAEACSLYYVARRMGYVRPDAKYDPATLCRP